jgi:hypothetical protein
MAGHSVKHSWHKKSKRQEMPGLIYKIIKVILLMSGAWLLVSCYPEYKLAKTFIESRPDISILVMPADYIFKNNLKRTELGDTTGMTPDQVDSVKMAKSLFLKEISDSVFLETFINSMITEFERLGIKVYINDADSFLFSPSPSYILNIAQLELEEKNLDQKDSETFEEMTYYKTIKTNAVNVNSWFELTWLNPKKEGRKLFFASETIADIVNGYFTQNLITGQVYYKYDIVKMDTDVIYRYCELLGIRYAGYTFDYLMNQYIIQNYPQDVKLKYYMHYDRSFKTLEPTLNDRFEIMEE